MNEELERLVDYAIIDGYITDKEKKVLFKKAEKQGFDVEELEMILEGKLFDLQQKNDKKKVKATKCPSCGEIMNGLSRVCPSCDYVMHTTSKNITSLDEYVESVESKMIILKKAPKTGVGKIIKSVLLIYLTCGIYIIYKKLIKKQNLFAPNNDDFAITNVETDGLLSLMTNIYGEDSKVSSYINKIRTEKDTLTKQRRTTATISVISGFVIVGSIFFLISQIPSPEPSESSKIEKLINEGKIQTAKSRVAVLKDEFDKEEFMETINNYEIDSLHKAGLYDQAIDQANMLTSDTERESKIDEIITTEVNELIKNKEFKKARERLDLLQGYLVRYDLEKKIEVAEKLNI